MSDKRREYKMTRNLVDKIVAAAQALFRTNYSVIIISTVGIGGLEGFKAWMADEDIDHQDGGGEDGETDCYETPGDALRAMADRLDRETLKHGWHAMRERRD